MTRFNALSCFLIAAIFFLSVSVAAARTGSSETKIVATGLHQGPRVAAGVRVTPAGSVTVQRPSPRSQARHPHPSLDWDALALCESSGNPRAVDPSHTYYGLYQFDLRTWYGVGGRGLPSEASPAEQLHRARLLYADRGRAPWPVCGVRL